MHIKYVVFIWMFSGPAQLTINSLSDCFVARATYTMNSLRIWLFHGSGHLGMALPWQCSGIAMALSWQCHGNAMAILSL